MSAGDVVVSVGAAIAAFSTLVAAATGLLQLRWAIEDRRERAERPKPIVVTREGHTPRTPSKTRQHSRVLKLMFPAALLVLLAAVVLIFIGREVQGPPVIADRFDDSAAGWTIIQDAELKYVAVGGNPDGYLSGTDLQNTMIPWFWEAPSKYLGDKSEYTGKSLSFDLMQSLTSNQFKAQDVWLLGPNDLALVYELPNSPGTAWTSYTVRLDGGAGWQKVAPGGNVPATEEDMRALLGKLTYLRIRGEYAAGADVGGLDNVKLGS